MVAIDKFEGHIGNLLGELYLKRVEELPSRVNRNLAYQIPIVDQNPDIRMLGLKLRIGFNPSQM